MVAARAVGRGATKSIGFSSTLNLNINPLLPFFDNVLSNIDEADAASPNGEASR